MPPQQLLRSPSCTVHGWLTRESFFSVFCSRLSRSFSLSQHPLPSDSAVSSRTSPVPEVTEDNSDTSSHSDSDPTLGATDSACSEDESESGFILDHRTTDMTLDVTEEQRMTNTPERHLMPCVPEWLEDGGIGESFSEPWITDAANHDPEPFPDQIRQDTRRTAEALRNGVPTHFCCD